MPEISLVDGIHLLATVRAVGLDNDNETVSEEDIDVLMDDELEGMLYRFSDEIRFSHCSDEQMASLAYMLADHIAPQILEVLLDMQRELRGVEQTVELIDRYEEEEPGWEV